MSALVCAQSHHYYLDLVKQSNLTNENMEVFLKTEKFYLPGTFYLVVFILPVVKSHISLFAGYRCLLTSSQLINYVHNETIFHW